mgnify:CR=1 FL=1
MYHNTYNMVRKILFPLLLTALVACTEHGEFERKLAVANSLMAAEPDSAYRMLDAMSDEAGQMPQAKRMRHLLLRTQAQRHAGIGFTSDSISNLLVSYYNAHGTPNERMTAHYLKGCSYLELGDEPATLRCFNEAVGTADTSALDCNYAQMGDIYGQIALQGPDSEKVMAECLGLACEDLVFYTFKTVDTEGETLIVSRTGYTGEDGFEVYGSHAYIQSAWDKLIAHGVKPCALGCRDTLRFEVGLPLYGDELTDDITPLEAGLGMFVKLDKENFIGKEALAKQKAEGLTRKIVGIELAGRAIPRHGYDVVVDDKVVGTVTTGYNSISTGKSVCMAMVDIEYTKLDTPVQIRIHKKLQDGVVCKKRFYEKNYKK